MKRQRVFFGSQTALFAIAELAIETHQRKEVTMSRITAKDLGELRESGTGAGRVLSVYLDVDQSKAANLNRRFENAFESRIQLIGRRFEEECEQSDFTRCVEDVRKLLLTYEPHARS